nr:MAG TPA: hypothetical protein [Caudoviricetes sp.]
MKTYIIYYFNEYGSINHAEVNARNERAAIAFFRREYGDYTIKVIK